MCQAARSKKSYLILSMLLALAFSGCRELLLKDPKRVEISYRSGEQALSRESSMSVVFKGVPTLWAAALTDVRFNLVDGVFVGQIELPNSQITDLKKSRVSVACGGEIFPLDILMLAKKASIASSLTQLRMTSIPKSAIAVAAFNESGCNLIVEST